MKEVIDVAVAIAFTLAMGAAGNYGLKQTVGRIQRAALTKAAKGLPPLTSFTKHLSGRY